MLEAREEIVHSVLRWGCRPLQHAQKIGLLDLEVVAAHMIWTNESDFTILKKHNVSVVHNPIANMILGSGVCPVQRLRKENINIGIGTDGTASNDSQNMIESLKITPMLQKIHHLDPSVMSAKDALKMATIEGAKALGISDIVGSIEPGKRADIALFSNTAELAIINTLVGNGSIFILGKVSIFPRYDWEHFRIEFVLVCESMKNSRLVYSTGNLPVEEKRAEETIINDDGQQIRLHLDRKGGGKVVTVVRGMEPSSSLRLIARELKKGCGVGGTVKNGDILIQGSHREKIKEILEIKGYKVKLSGG